MENEVSTPRMNPTKPTRIAGDLGEKLDEILYVLGSSSAEYLDPFIRVQIENDHKASLPAITAMRRARERAAKARAEADAPVMSNDLGGEAGGA